MDRQKTIYYMSNQVSLHEQVAVIQDYIFELKKVRWNPEVVDINQINDAFSYIIQYYAAKFFVNVLRNSEGNVLKIY